MTEKKADPGVPSSFHLKDQVLAEMAEQKRQVRRVSCDQNDRQQTDEGRLRRHESLARAPSLSLMRTRKRRTQGSSLSLLQSLPPRRP